MLSYAAGIFNGVGDARNSSNIGFQDNREFDGRLFVQPFKANQHSSRLQNLGFGVGGSWGDSSITNTLGLPNTTGGSQPGYFTDGQQQFFAYTNAWWPPHALAAFATGLLLLRPAEFDG